MTFDLKAQPASISSAICGLRRTIIVFSFFQTNKMEMETDVHFATRGWLVLSRCVNHTKKKPGFPDDFALFGIKQIERYCFQAENVTVIE